MFFFRVTENINIKTTDNTLVRYTKFKKPSELYNDSIYCTVYDDFIAVKKVFAGVGEKYKAKIISEKKIRALNNFPRQLGINYSDEYNIRDDKKEHTGFYINDQFTDIQTQLCTAKKDISIVVVGSLSSSIGQMVCGLSALRILYQTLIKRFKTVKIDLYINASQNQYYTRDKEMFKNAPFINSVMPLSINVKKLCEYDFYIDMGSYDQTLSAQQFNYIDAFLHKFGIDYKKIPDAQKHNEIYFGANQPSQELEDKLKTARLKGNLILFHPYTSVLQRSIPSDVAKKMIQKLLNKLDDSIVVSVLEIDKIKADNYINLAKYSKSFYDFAYIISSMDSIITADTSTYHIADAFAIPTVVIFTNTNPKQRIEYYSQTKAVQIVDKTKNYSWFEYENEALTLHRANGWRSLKVKQLLNLLK